MARTSLAIDEVSISTIIFAPPSAGNRTHALHSLKSLVLVFTGNVWLFDNEVIRAWGFQPVNGDKDLSPKNSNDDLNSNQVLRTDC